MKYYLLKISSLNITVNITEEEKNMIALIPNDQSIAISRLDLIVQKRFCNIMPANNPDMIKDREKQQTGRLHDGTRVKKHFNIFVLDGHDVPDDKGVYSPVNLNPEVYPEARIGVVATEEEWQEIQKTGADYYEFLGINNKIKRLDNKKGFTKLIK